MSVTLFFPFPMTVWNFDELTGFNGSVAKGGMNPGVRMDSEDPELLSQLGALVPLGGGGGGELGCCK